jgi:hypothetical protein
MLSQFVFVLKIKIKCVCSTWWLPKAALPLLRAKYYTMPPLTLKADALPPMDHFSVGTDYILSPRHALDPLPFSL